MFEQAVQPEASLKALQVLEDMYDWLLSHVAALKSRDEAADTEAAATGRPHVPALSLTSPSSPTAANTEVWPHPLPSLQRCAIWGRRMVFSGGRVCWRS